MVDQSCGCQARTCHRRQTRPQTANSEDVSSEKIRNSKSSLRRSNSDVLCADDVDVDHFLPLQAASRASVVTCEWIDGADDEDEMSVPGVGGGCGRGDLRGARCCGCGANGDGDFLQTKYSDLGDGVSVRSAKSLGDH